MALSVNGNEINGQNNLKCLHIGISIISIYNLNVENQYCRYYSLIINMHIFLERTLFSLDIFILVEVKSNIIDDYSNCYINYMKSLHKNCIHQTNNKLTGHRQTFNRLIFIMAAIKVYSYYYWDWEVFWSADILIFHFCVTIWNCTQ